MTAPEINERFSRQVILPGVGPEGQKKWADAVILLAGEGAALEAAQTALRSAGACETIFLNPESPSPLPSFSAALVLTEKPEWRRKVNRLLRLKKGKAVFAWTSGSGFAVFAADLSKNPCPCLECFEVMNPKAFSKGNEKVQRFLGAAAASEVLQFILKGDSPLEGQVWMTSLEEGVSFRHQVRPTPKCPARLLEEGAEVTP